MNLDKVTERENRCINYINENTGNMITEKDLVESKVVPCGLQLQLDFHKAELFHNIAELMGIKKLNRYNSKIDYDLPIPIEEGGHDYWSVVLNPRISFEFLDKHKQDYRWNI